MKIHTFLVYVCILISTNNISAHPKRTIHAPLDIISLEDITPEERKQIAYLEYKLNRSKRSGSGSGDILGALAKAIGQGLKKKIGQIAKASVSASGHFSSSSSSSGHSEHGYSYHPPPDHGPETHDHKSFDFWSLKTSILNTLLQAVKAIKGGVIAIKGQLIKGSGKLISVKGQLISQQGDSITQLGKNIASSAVLVPFKEHSSSGHEDYHHSAPSAPETIYHESPSASESDYHVPGNYPPPPHPEADGLLILKKIRSQHYAEPHDVPPFKPIDPTGPSFGTIAGKLFSASTSLDPHKPEPFGNTASGGIPSTHNTISSEGYKAPKPTTSYGTPFEEPPSYLNQNFGDYASQTPQAGSQSSSSSGYSQSPVNQNAFGYPTANSQNIADLYNSFPSNSQQQSVSYQVPFASVAHPSPSVQDLPNLADYPDGFPPSTDYQSAASSSIRDVYFQQPPADALEQIPKPSPYLQSPQARLNDLDVTLKVSKHKIRSSSYRRPIVTKGLSSYRSFGPSSNDYELVQSMSFELGPNGPKRLT